MLLPVITTSEQYGIELKKTVSYLPFQTKYSLDVNGKNIPELLSLVNQALYV